MYIRLDDNVAVDLLEEILSRAKAERSDYIYEDPCAWDDLDE